MNAILEFFKLLIGPQWVAQWIGVIAMSISFAGYLGKNSHRIFFFQIITNGIWAVHLFMIGAYTGMVLNILGFVRSLFLYFEDKKWARSMWSCAGITLLMAVSCVYTWQGWPSLLSTLAQVVGTPLFWTRKDKVVRWAQFVWISPLWLVHNILEGSVAGTFTEILNMVSVGTAMIKYRKHEA